MTQTGSQPSELKKIAKSALLIALGNAASRVLGLVREMLKSNLFGAGGTVDAFNVAVRVPVLLYDLLVGGMINSSLVPMFATAAQNRADLWKLVSVVLNIAAVIMAVLVILLELFAPHVAFLLSSGSSPEVLALTTRLLRITIPALFFLSLGGVLSALLYATNQVLYPALMAAVFNLAMVVITLLLFRPLGITAMALGLLVGGAASMIIQVYGLRGSGFHYSFIFQHPGLKQVLSLYAPIIAGLLVEVLVSKPVTYNLASRTGTGGIAWMDYATTLWQLPQGLVATAVSFAILPTLSAQAASGQILAFRETLAQGIRFISLLIIPAAVGMFVLARPIVGLLFEHGSFTAHDTTMTSQVLRLYLLGLPFNAIDLLLVFAFYARKNTLTPALIGAVLTVFYVGLAVVLLPLMGLLGIMVSDSIRIFFHALISAWLLKRSLGGSGGISWALMRVLFLAGVMGIVIYGALWATRHILAGATGLFSEVLLIAIPSLIGGAAYLLLVSMSGFNELTLFWSMVRRRFSK